MAISKRLRFEVLRRDGHTCRYCGRGAPEVKLTVDHVIAEALGGRDEPTNLVAACADCNSGKSATPVDAATVVDVAEDALRWARAVAQAADEMLADLQARQADRSAFEARWKNWSLDGGRAVPLPVDWRQAVDRFVAAGLPLPVLLDCIDAAMTNQKVRHDNLFRYTCGIAWARVGQLHEAARTEGHVGGQRPGGDRLAERLTNVLQADLGEEGLGKLLARARESLGEVGSDNPSPADLLAQCVGLLLADTEEVYSRLYLLGRLARKSVPEQKLNALVEATEAELKGNLGNDWSAEDFEFNLARNALIGLGELAKRAGGAA